MTDCPLDNKYWITKIVYWTDVFNHTNDDKNFFEVYETLFIERFKNDNKEFTHKKY